MKETQKETEKKETEKDTQQEKETVKGKQQVKRKGKVAMSNPSTPAEKDRTDSVTAAKSLTKSKSAKVVGDLEPNSLCVGVYIDKWFSVRVLDNTGVKKGLQKLNFAKHQSNNSFIWDEKEDIFTTPVTNIIMAIKETDTYARNTCGAFGLCKEPLDLITRRMEETKTWTEYIPEDEDADE